MRIFLLAFGLLIAPLFQAAAQVTVEVLLDELEFLRDESLLLKVRIVNRSGQVLKFGQTADWLVFNVQSQDGHNVEKIGELPVTGEFTIESSQSATKGVDLMPWFAFPQPGRYSVTATVKIPQWRDDFISTPKSFHIIRGSRVWEQEFGVPRKEGAPEVRQYSLVRASGMKMSRLYVRVTDVDDNRVFRVTSLGQVVSFGKPEAQVDRLSQLHVLLQNGARSFQYAVFNPEGDWVARQTFEYTESRPVLRVNDAGRVLVAGGQRRFSAADYPPPAPAPVSAEATNSPAGDLNTNRVTISPAAPAIDGKKTKR